MTAATDLMLRQQLVERRQRLAPAVESSGRDDLAQLLHQVDAALERLEDGSFGLCTHCQVPVETDRLAADPLVELCLDCLAPGQKRALERDLETAARIQSALLPQPDTSLAGWDVHYRYQPAGPLGGDHVDLVRSTADESAYLFFGDVSGKGVAASLLMANLQALLRSLAALAPSPRELLRDANRLFCQGTTPNSFATLVAARVTVDGALEIANAGHNPPLLVGRGEPVAVSATGLPLGLFCDASYDAVDFDLGVEDLLFLYTDGLSESTDPQGREYGDRRLARLLGGARGLSSSETTDLVLEDLASFGGGASRRDDLTLMVLRRTSRRPSAPIQRAAPARRTDGGNARG